MNNVIKTASTSTDDTVGIGKNEGKEKIHYNESEEDTIENNGGTVIPPFQLASEHEVIQDVMHSGGPPPTAFVTPGKEKEKGKSIEDLTDPDPDEFKDRYMSNDEIEEVLADSEKAFEETKEEKEEEKDIQKNKNKNENKKEQTREKANAITTEEGDKPKTNAIYMDYREFKKWDLENKIPGLVNNFWMLHPQVILTGMSYWLHYNVDIKIPFKWNAVDFQCPYTKPPITAPKGDHYKEMTMIEVILKCQEFIDSPPNKGRHTAGLKENIVKYPPKIVKLR